MLRRVQGMIAIWIPLASLAALASLLFVPLTVRAELRLSLRGGACALTLRYLLLCHTFRFRIHLLEEPMLSVEYLHPNGQIRRIEKSEPTKKDRVNPLTILHRVRFRSLRMNWQIGVADAPALTAILAGLLGALTQEAAAFVFRDNRQDAAIVHAEPAFDRDVCFFSLSGIATALPAHIIREILWKKRRR